jgi:tripartite-type tricarboxylate transporter receptor subunit TctC
MRPCKLALLLAAALTLQPLVPALAQMRSSTVRIVFPFPGGGSGDALTRLIAEGLGARLGQPVIVEPRPGAAGRLGVQAVKSAEPNGHTLLMTPIAPMAVYQSVYPSLEYDPVKDFAAVSQVASFEFGICIGPHVPATTLAELVDWLKKNPALANFGTPGAGTLPHFFGLMFARAAGISLQHIAYKGGTQALTDLMGGQISIVLLSTNELTELHKANRLRVLATSNLKRSEFLPDVPTFRESGIAIEGTGWFGMFAPAQTPPEIVAKLNAAVVDTLNDQEVKEKVRRLGLQPTGTSAEEFARIQREDIARWAPAVKASGFSPEQ